MLTVGDLKSRGIRYKMSDHVGGLVMGMIERGTSNLLDTHKWLYWAVEFDGRKLRNRENPPPETIIPATLIYAPIKAGLEILTGEYLKNASHQDVVRVLNGAYHDYDIRKKFSLGHIPNLTKTNFIDGKGTAYTRAQYSEMALSDFVAVLRDGYNGEPKVAVLKSSDEVDQYLLNTVKIIE